jgi:hypothetical protein
VASRTRQSSRWVSAFRSKPPVAEWSSSIVSPSVRRARKASGFCKGEGSES